MEAVSGQLSVVSRTVDFQIAGGGGDVLERAAKETGNLPRAGTGWDSAQPAVTQTA